MSAFDVVILGSSPNALAAAARLARAGRRVLVLESRDRVGGPVATETFAPGFRADTGVTACALAPEIVRDLDLQIEPLHRDRVTLLGATPHTLDRAPEFPRSVQDAVALLRTLYRQPPPELPRPAASDRAHLATLAAQLAAAGPRPMHEALRLLFMPVRDWVEEQAFAPAVKTLLAVVALRGASDGPFASGTLFGLLHRLATDDALFRASATGGVQRVAQALADRARALGAELRTGVDANMSIVLEGDVATGVRVAGETITAALVLSDHDARTTFTRLISPSALDPEFNRAIRALRYYGSVARVHLALRSQPHFPGVVPEALRGTLVLAGDVSDLERAWDAAKRRAASPRPYVELTIPTLADPTLAPVGKHVLSAWVQHVPHGVTDPAPVLRTVLDQLETAAPGLRDQILHSAVALPADLAAGFGLTEGQLEGGPIRLESTFFLRPQATPIERLHLCGSGAHPGGYSGLSGWTVAGRILA